jgi:hypothetical protein
MPRRALERQPHNENTRRTETVGFARPSESISVHSEYKSGETKSAGGTHPSVNKDDLDIPTFLRNRR